MDVAPPPLARAAFARRIKETGHEHEADHDEKDGGDSRRHGGIQSLGRAVSDEHGDADDRPQRERGPVKTSRGFP